MLHFGWSLEAMADELPPGFEILRAPEIHGVALDRLPLDQEQISARALDRTLQFHPVTALRTRKNRRSLADTGLELLGHADLHVDACDFKDHASLLWRVCPT